MFSMTCVSLCGACSLAESCLGGLPLDTRPVAGHTECMTTTARQHIETITATKGSPADVNEIWFNHVNRWTWIGMGANPRSIVRTEDGMMVDIYLGAGTRKRRLIIKLNAADRYDIEIGRLHRTTLEWIPEAQTLGVYCDGLDAALQALYDANKI